MSDASTQRRLLLLGVVALALRLLGANAGLWTDELIALPLFRSSLSALVTGYPGDFHHPLYSILARVASGTLGEHPWTLRLPSLVAGAATVPLLLVFARTVTSRGTALLAAVLLATSYHHIWFSQNARGYVLLSLLTVAATLLLRRALLRGEVWAWGGYAACVALGAYTHLTMILVAFGHFVAALVWQSGGIGPAEPTRSRADWLRIIGAFALAALGTVALYLPMMRDVFAWFFETESNYAGLSTPSWALGEAIRGLGIGLGGGAAVAAGAGVFLVGLVGCLKREGLATLLMIMPGAFVLAGALLVRGTLYPRFFVFLLPFAYLIVAQGFAALAARLPQGRAVRVAAVALVVVHLLPLARLYRYPKQDFAGAVAFTEAANVAGERVVTTGVAAELVGLHWNESWPHLETLADLEAINVGEPVWVLYTLPRFLEFETPDLQARMQECELKKHLPGTLGGGDFFVRRCPRLVTSGGG